MSPTHDDTWPLSASQTGIWFAQQSDPATPMFTNAEYYEINGPVDADVLGRAVDTVVAWAETLRLRFVETEDGPRQYPDPGARRPLRVVDLSDAPDPRAAALTWMREDVGRTVDPLTDELCAFALFRLGAEEYYWYQRAHHLVVDGYTFMLLARGIASVYTALADGEEPEASFGTFRELLEENERYGRGEDAATDRRYWEERLAGAPAYTALTDRTAPAQHHYLRSTALVDEEGFARVAEAAARIGTGWKQLIMAVAAVYTRHWSGEDDVLLSLPVAARTTELSRRTPGMQSNVMPLRCTVGDATPFAELARTVAADLRSGLPHQRYPVASVLRLLGQTSDARHECGPIVNIMAFDYDLSFAGVPAVPHNIFQGPIEEMRIDVLQRGRGGALHIDFDANPAVLSAEELELHRRSFEVLLDTVCADPDLPVGDIDAHPWADRLRQIAEFNAAGHPLPPLTVPEVFEGHVRRAPESVAV
ncbi:condensation domain-containing protein, partial [Nocardiopsis sp. LOL_012]|uniref:condensation domain-containing protein n=1 Tax=Nocardiopsis sp. LOL_012 TaxID=3345409 RepID=UPI003A84AF7C